MTVKEFFKDWENATIELSDSEKGRLMNAVVALANGEEVTVNGNEKFVLPLFMSRFKEENEEEEAEHETEEVEEEAEGNV